MARPLHPELAGRYATLTSHLLTASTGAVTVAQAGTATLGHIFTFRWDPTDTTQHCYVWGIWARFTLTTAYTTAQETGCDLILAKPYTVAHTGGTAVDVGGTISTTNKLLTANTTIAAASCRVATTAGMTAGTHTLDANPIAVTSGWSTGIGSQVCDADGGPRALFDANKVGAPLILSGDEGFIIRNLVLMGAVGVGRWDFTVSYDVGVPT